MRLIFATLMGRIKTKKVNAVTFELLERYRARFSTDFGANKAALRQVAEIQSSKLRNVIAGYITRLMQAQKA